MVMCGNGWAETEAELTSSYLKIHNYLTKQYREGNIAKAKFTKFHDTIWAKLDYELINQKYIEDEHLPKSEIDNTKVSRKTYLKENFIDKLTASDKTELSVICLQEISKNLF